MAHDIDTGLLLSQDPLKYVAHPINAYYLMKRTAVQWKTLFDILPEEIYLVSLKFLGPFHSIITLLI